MFKIKEIKLILIERRNKNKYLPYQNELKHSKKK